MTGFEMRYYLEDYWPIVAIVLANGLTLAILAVLV
jgi:hypothetical protein